ncbi:hypothetical protein ESCAB7627_0854 [Escherichia albertii TW07627]|uniref:Uncharacterized protein n=1 Tax=Escherichia albertii (strain TW07627) TaxID=502347 RepID=A0ABC9NTC3_ESCAT|nr:hypothetical protein ESCAB7627_0854 [Escherichia albertii TW07627]
MFILSDIDRFSGPIINDDSWGISFRDVSILTPFLVMLPTY